VPNFVLFDPKGGPKTLPSSPGRTTHRKRPGTPTGWTEAEAAKDSFAAAFHLRQLLKHEPNDEEWKTKLAAEKQLNPRELAPPPRAGK
jgi:hypothetical protein